MLVDSHCHLDLDKQTPAETLLQNAQEMGVNHCLCVSVDLESFPTVLSHAQQHDNVFASVGVHPNSTGGVDPTVEQLVELADDENIIAIGETGLDYFRSQGDLTWQHDRFKVHIEAAKQTKKPLIIHTRESAQDTVKVLQAEKANEIGGVMHCFVEDWETASQAMDMNFYISFSGIVTFKSAKDLQEVAKKVPLDRMLVETDSPYLAPVPHRGKINQPAYTRHVAQFIADLRGESLETIAEHTTQNFFRLFNLNR
ncbi:TatD family hydrolase [Candidatus Albibeggiatoa sp. nov. NOAA]|uniref:TatD family hydrolase n=1 Tax=Candidatus Albibeggiatoa sp. nov. NOAA TaxID=3162724 RepID=UPI0033022495|nr:TatD family hydrolase [Thiotrichaceae bacterium]